MNRRSAVATVAAVVLAFCGIFSGPAARAEMVTTPQLLHHDSRSEQETAARAFLDREDVRTQLQQMGVDPAVAKQRVAGLTDSELQQVSKAIDGAPAPGDLGTIFIVLGVIFVILLVLELLGVTHIFRRF